MFAAAHTSTVLHQHRGPPPTRSDPESLSATATSKPATWRRRRVGDTSPYRPQTLADDTHNAHNSRAHAGGSLALVTALLGLFGAYKQSSGASFVLTLPGAIWELSLGVYLIARGFKPSPVLYDDGRHTGVDGPLLPVLTAPELLAAP